VSGPVTHRARTVTTCDYGGAAAAADLVPRTVPVVLLQFCTTVIVTWPVADGLFRLSACGSAGEVDPVDFDALRAAVVPGAGVVGRWPGVICVAECTDRAVLRRLLDVCASAVGAEPGRTLARKLAMWLGGPDAPGAGLRFGTVAATGAEARAGAPRGEQWAVFLYGPVGLVVPDRQVALSGAQSVAWTDRLLPRPDAPVVLALEGGPIPPGMVDGVHDLRAGIVPGAGAVLVPGADSTTGDAADEAARNRPDEAGWLDATGAPERSAWPTEPAPTASVDGLYHADGQGNGVPPRGNLGSIDGYGDYEGATPGLDRPSGRAHLRPVPSGSNGSGHRNWVPRRGSALDIGRFPAGEQDRGAHPAEDYPTDPGPPARVEHDEERPPELAAPGIGDDHAPDHGHPLGDQSLGDRPDADAAPGDQRHDDHSHNDHSHNDHPPSGLNGARTNGASYDLLGDRPDPPREPARSPWSDGRGAGRQERIEGWFATTGEAGTESDLGAVSPGDRRRPRHGRREEDAPTDPEYADGARNGAAAGGELGSPGGDHLGPSPADPNVDSADFGAGSGEARIPDARAAAVIDVGSPSAGGQDLDGSGEGTPRLGVPRTSPDAPTEPEPEPAPEPAPEREAAAPHTTVLRSERILGVASGESERPALDDGIATSGLAVDSRPHAQQIRGYPCARGHLNDPRAPVCAMCGVPMEEQAGPPVVGPRPPLGLLAFEDGATYTVDAEYLMGRLPEADPRVISGALRALALEDTSGAVSRVHAQIVLDGWDTLIVDAGSRNGTFVCAPGEQGWTQLPAGESYRLVPGSRVRIGGRSFQFESPSGAR
jgi:FHA domain-containing protein